MAGRPDASAYPRYGVHSDRRVSPLAAAYPPREERSGWFAHEAGPTVAVHGSAHRQSPSIDALSKPESDHPAHLMSTRRQVHAARPKPAALPTTITHRPTPVKGSGG